MERLRKWLTFVTIALEFAVTMSIIVCISGLFTGISSLLQQTQELRKRVEDIETAHACEAE